MAGLVLGKPKVKWHVKSKDGDFGGELPVEDGALRILGSAGPEVDTEPWEIAALGAHYRLRQ